MSLLKNTIAAVEKMVAPGSESQNWHYTREHIDFLIGEGFSAQSDHFFVTIQEHQVMIALNESFELEIQKVKVDAIPVFVKHYPVTNEKEFYASYLEVLADLKTFFATLKKEAVATN